MKNQKGAVSMVVVILLVLFLAGVVGYLVWQKNSNAILDPQDNRKTVKVGDYTLAHPPTWTDFTPVSGSKNTYTFNVQGSVENPNISVSKATLEIVPSASLNLDWGGAYFYIYDAASNTWEQNDGLPDTTQPRLLAKFMGDGSESQYSLTAKYYRVIGSDTATISVQETGKPADQYSFSGGTPYAANNLQNDIINTLDSIK